MSKSEIVFLWTKLSSYFFFHFWSKFQRLILFPPKKNAPPEKLKTLECAYSIQLWDHARKSSFLSLFSLLSQDHSENPLGAAVTLAHELGHNFGMNHDTPERGCGCRMTVDRGGCIMTPSTGWATAARWLPTLLSAWFLFFKSEIPSFLKSLNETQSVLKKKKKKRKMKIASCPNW